MPHLLWANLRSPSVGYHARSTEAGPAPVLHWANLQTFPQWARSCSGCSGLTMCLCSGGASPIFVKVKLHLPVVSHPLVPLQCSHLQPSGCRLTSALALQEESLLKNWSCSSHLFPKARDLRRLQVSWESQAQPCPHLAPLWLLRWPLHLLLLTCPCLFPCPLVFLTSFPHPPT